PPAPKSRPRARGPLCATRRRCRSCPGDLLPFPEHKNAPQQGRPVPLPALMLFPATAQERLVQHVISALENCFLRQVLQLSAKPFGYRNREAFLFARQNLPWQYALQRFLENVLAAAVVQLEAGRNLRD